jgi:hypothetical protein
MKRRLTILFLVGAAVLVPVEFLCVRSALETQGEVMQAALFVVLCGNLLCVPWLWRSPRVALIGLLVVGLLIIPYQVFLLDRLVRLNNEMIRLVDSRLRLRAEGKAIPATLDDFKFSDPKLRKFVWRYGVNDDCHEFWLEYFVVQPGITHSYSSDRGWFYYPD